jgi:hypothetical protein
VKWLKKTGLEQKNKIKIALFSYNKSKKRTYKNLHHIPKKRLLVLTIDHKMDILNF